jgi:hypothetical protein
MIIAMLSLNGDSPLLAVVAPLRQDAHPRGEGLSPLNGKGLAL